MHKLRISIAGTITVVAFLLVTVSHIEGVFSVTNQHSLVGNTIDWQLTDYSYDSDSETIVTDDTTNTNENTSTSEDDTKTVIGTTDEDANNENSTILTKQTCPFTEEEGSMVLDLSTQNTVEETLESGMYSITLASYYSRNIFTSADTTHEGWRIIFKNKDEEPLTKSAVARTASYDEQLAIELVNSDIFIPSNVQYVQSQSENGTTDFNETVPLCVLLKSVGSVKEESFIEADFQSKMEETKRSFTEQKEEMEESFIENKNEAFSNFENSTVVTEGRERVVQENTTEENLVTVYTLDVGVYGTNTPITLEQHVAEKRKVLMDMFEGESLFAVLQDGRHAVRESILTKVKGKSDVFTTQSGTVHINTQIDTSVESEKVLEAFRYQKRNELAYAIDTDGDGVTDYDERYIYKTDPEHAFTSRTVLTDGERILLNLDPTDSTYNTVPLESPQLSTEQKSDTLFAVEDITYVQGDSEDLTHTPPKNVQIKGQAQPLSFVTLYVYSTPIVVTVRTNEMGRFEYTLDRTLENGEHELYIATVNSSGRILAKSSAIPFVKTAEAITYEPANISSIKTPVDNALQKLLILGLLLVLLVAVGIILLVGYVKSHHDEERAEGNHHEETTQ